MPDVLAETLASPAVGAVGTSIGVAVIALWLAGAWWAYADAGRRTDSAFAAMLAAGWIVVSTPLLLPISLAVYAFARPPVTAADHRARSLVTQLSAIVDAASACPTCIAQVETTWLRCPACATWLAAPCSACGEWSAPGLELCPFCGSEGHDAPVTVEHTPIAQPAPRTDRVGVTWGPPEPSRPVTPSRPVGRSRPSRPSRASRRAGAAEHAATATAHGTAAAGELPAAAVVAVRQRGRSISSSARPRSYSTSRESLSAPS